MNVQTIERSNNQVKKAAADIDMRGGDSSQLLEKIEYYERELKHYKKVLYYMRWI